MFIAWISAWNTVARSSSDKRNVTSGRSIPNTILDVALVLRTVAVSGICQSGKLTTNKFLVISADYQNKNA